MLVQDKAASYRCWFKTRRHPMDTSPTGLSQKKKSETVTTEVMSDRLLHRRILDKVVIHQAFLHADSSSAKRALYE